VMVQWSCETVFLFKNANKLEMIEDLAVDL
jgi:hypothetical protein